MERLYEVSESIFGVVAPGIVAKGWSVFPQEPRGQRRPEVVDGVMLKWRAYQTRLPTTSEIESWAAQCPAANVAFITGSASGGIFAIDIDCYKEELAWAIRGIAEREMGRTMLRMGSRPLLVYRCAEPIGCKAYRFERLEDESEDQAIEILGNGAAFTGFGHHHKTGNYFTWRWGQPGVNKPEDAALVTVGQLRRFIAAVDKLRPFKGCKPTSPGAILAPDQPVHYSHAGAAIIPHAWASREGKWDLVDGVVIHGRDAFLLAWSYAICAPIENRHLLSSEAGRRQLIESATSVAFNSVARGGKPERWMEEAIADKIRRTAKKILTGELRSAAPLIPKKEGGYQRAVAATSRTLTVLADPALDWLGNGDVAGKLTTWDRVLKTTGERLVEGALEARALRTDRTETLKRLDAEVNAALSEALADAVEKRPVVHMIPAPTGTGKTRTTAHRIVDFLSGRPGKELVLFLAPTHENLRETAKHFRDAGAFVFGDKGFETASVKVVPYMSKIRAGCCREADVAALSASGFGSSGLCEGKVQRRNGGTVTWEKATCIHASTCGYQRMRRAAAESRVILAPHAYQTLKAVPVEMKSPTEVVIDESVIFKLTHCDRLPLSVLDLLRSPPAPTKGERADKVDTGQYLVSRDKAVAVVKRAIAEGFDLSRIADRFLDTEGGDVLLGDCIAVTGRALEVARDINPESTSLGIERITKDAKAEFIHLEWRWWKIVEEWYADRKADRIADTLEKETGVVTPRRCLSDGDTRIQLLSDLVGDEEVLSIRVAWLTEPNWSGVPTILLDASAQMEVVESIYAGSTVRRHDISVDLNMRTVAVADATYSTASMTGDDENVDSATLVDKLRRAVSVVSGVHSFGSVAFGAAKEARAEIMDDWTAPLNLGDGHFGAFRGIDVFKDHVAAIGIGRSEMPIWLVDGIVAALTYKSCPQIPFDLSGTGRLPDGKPLMRPSRRLASRFPGRRNGLFRL